MQQGTVAWFNAAKGYGFIKPDDGVDVFVHYTAIDQEGYRQLQQGQRVSFEIVKGRNDRPQAASVTVLAETAKA